MNYLGNFANWTYSLRPDSFGVRVWLTKGGGALELAPELRSKVKRVSESNADNGWLHNGSAPNKLPCSSIGIALHYVYARRNHWLYR